MRLHIPNSAFLGNIESFVRRLDSREDETLSVTFNQKWMSVHPVVLCMAAALIQDVKSQGGSIQVETPQARSRHYLQRMGLTELLGIEPEDIRENEPAGRFIPIRRISEDSELAKFIQDVVPLLHLEPERAEPINYVLGELIRNVLEHAHAKSGAFVSAQYFKKSNRISIGVADRGMGVKQALAKAYKTNSDLQALELAMTPGITGTTRVPGGTGFNAGAGLFFTKSIAKTSRDFFLIYSGSAMYKLLKTPESKQVKLHADPNRDKHTDYDDLPFWKGTAVGIDITLDHQIPFDELLTQLGKLLEEGVRARKKAYYKRIYRPRFT